MGHTTETKRRKPGAFEAFEPNFLKRAAIYGVFLDLLQLNQEKLRLWFSRPISILDLSFGFFFLRTVAARAANRTLLKVLSIILCARCGGGGRGWRAGRGAPRRGVIEAAGSRFLWQGVRPAAAVQSGPPSSALHHVAWRGRGPLAIEP